MKTSRLQLFQGVIATRDLVIPDLMGFWGAGKPGLINGEPGVLKGTRGVIMEMADASPGIVVEFFDENDETIDVALIPPRYIRAETKSETAARLARPKRHERPAGVEQSAG